MFDLCERKDSERERSNLTKIKEMTGFSLTLQQKNTLKAVLKQITAT